MATYENNVILRTVDDDGNIRVFLPVTKAENVEDFDEAVKELSIPTITTGTLTASKWSNKSYSFEATYPSTSYDLEIAPDGDSITETQLTAWDKARILSRGSSNSIKAIGDVPTINIPIIIKVVKK